MNCEIDGIKFDSDFDSGNCGRVERLGEWHFALYTRNDCAATPFQNHYSTWFHFSMEGVPGGQEVTLTVKNMNKQKRLYGSFGMKPVMKSLPSRPQWERCKSQCTFRMEDDKEGEEEADENEVDSENEEEEEEEVEEAEEEGRRDGRRVERGNALPENKFSITFSHKFEHGQVTFFAFSFPWSYTECQQKLEALDSRFVSKGRVAARSKNGAGIYFSRELLARSNAGRRIDLLTVTSMPRLMTDGKRVQYEEKECPSPFKGKRVILLTARVHPGETPASHMFNGFLDFILHEQDPRAKILRDNFLFKLVPMLNPDGVANGHYRTYVRNEKDAMSCQMHARWTNVMSSIRSDLRGENLNRCYRDPTPTDHPSIFAVKELMRTLSNSTDLCFYIDLHAHSNKRGCFAFGNYFPDASEHIDNVLFPRLIGMNTQHFEFRACNFSAKNMKAKGKRGGLSKDGTGRVAMYHDTGLLHCYTIECNYSTGRMLNHLPPIAVLESSATPRKSGATLKAMMERRALKQPPKYTIRIFQEMGEAIAIALLDFYEINPYSRLPRSSFKDMHRLRGSLMRYIATKRRRRTKKKTGRKNTEESLGTGKSTTIVKYSTTSSNSEPSDTPLWQPQGEMSNILNDCEWNDGTSETSHMIQTHNSISTVMDQLPNPQHPQSGTLLQSDSVHAHQFPPHPNSKSLTAQEKQRQAGSRIRQLIRQREKVEQEVNELLGNNITARTTLYMSEDDNSSLDPDDRPAPMLTPDDIFYGGRRSSGIPRRVKSDVIMLQNQALQQFQVERSKHIRPRFASMKISAYPQ